VGQVFRNETRKSGKMGGILRSWHSSSVCPMECGLHSAVNWDLKNGRGQRNWKQWLWTGIKMSWKETTKLISFVRIKR